MASEDETLYCICRKPYQEEEFMIECEICTDWFHGSCVGIKEHQASDIEIYHCPNCQRIHGPLVLKKRRNWHRRDYSESDENINKAVQTGTVVFIRELKHRTFPSADEIPISRLRGYELTRDYLEENGFSVPILVEQKDGLDLKIPPPSFAIQDVENHVGSMREIAVIDVVMQDDHKMLMREWTEYYNSPNRTKIYNVISLEFSKTKLAELVSPPRIVQEMSWVSQYWPEDQPPEDAMYQRPEVQRYCLMGVKDSFTDFHIDFGGTSVWYHVLRGEKVFYLIRPTSANLALYETWLSCSNQSEMFFGDQVDACYKCVVKQGHTLFIPTGWIHAVFTPIDSLVFGGNFLHSFNIDLQIQVYEIEKRVNTEEKYLYPNYETVHWYAAKHLLDALRDYREEALPIPDYMVEGAKALAPALKSWTHKKDYIKRDSIPETIQYGRLLKDLNKELKIFTGKEEKKSQGKKSKKQTGQAQLTEGAENPIISQKVQGRKSKSQPGSTGNENQSPERSPKKLKSPIRMAKQSKVSADSNLPSPSPKKSPGRPPKKPKTPSVVTENPFAMKLTIPPLPQQSSQGSPLYSPTSNFSSPTSQMTSPASYTTSPGSQFTSPPQFNSPPARSTQYTNSPHAIPSAFPNPTHLISPSQLTGQSLSTTPSQSQLTSPSQLTSSSQFASPRSVSSRSPRSVTSFGSPTGFSPPNSPPTQHRLQKKHHSGLTAKSDTSSDPESADGLKVRLPKFGAYHDTSVYDFSDEPEEETPKKLEHRRPSTPIRVEPPKYLDSSEEKDLERLSERMPAGNSEIEKAPASSGLKLKVSGGRIISDEPKADPGREKFQMMYPQTSQEGSDTSEDEENLVVDETPKKKTRVQRQMFGLPGMEEMKQGSLKLKLSVSKSVRTDPDTPGDGEDAESFMNRLNMPEIRGGLNGSISDILEASGYGTETDFKTDDDINRASPTMRDAIQGMLSMSRIGMLSTLVTSASPAEKARLSTRTRRAAAADEEGTEKMPTCFKDEEFVYPTLDVSDNEDDHVFKPRGRPHKDETWNPKAKLNPNCPKPERPHREGVVKESVQSGLAAAAAKYAHLPPPKRQYVRRKPKPEKKTENPYASDPQPGSSLSLSIVENPKSGVKRPGGTVTSPVKCKKPRKGMATAKQRLGKILKIHKMMM